MIISEEACIAATEEGVKKLPSVFRKNIKNFKCTEKICYKKM